MNEVEIQLSELSEKSIFNISFSFLVLNFNNFFKGSKHG